MDEQEKQPELPNIHLKSKSTSSAIPWIGLLNLQFVYASTSTIEQTVTL
ncbi:unnamed protein product [Rhodiola kirilowii]